jgi:DNA-binding Lrp family transcriptional regulator
MLIDLSPLENHIIQLLKKNARLPINSIAASVGASRLTVQKKIQKLEQAGHITGYTVKLKTDSFKHKVKGWMTINTIANKEEAAIKSIVQIAEVTALYTTNGKWDLAAEITALNLEEFDRAVSRLRTIPGIEHTETNLLLSSRIGE